jgi:CBS domain-containing protein
MARQVYSVRDDDVLETAEELMQRNQVRRVPVVDGEGHLQGILSLNDLARHAGGSWGRSADGLSRDVVVKTLAAICTPPVADKST